jgi:hypothetical protein
MQFKYIENVLEINEVIMHACHDVWHCQRLTNPLGMACLPPRLTTLD